MVIFMPYYRQHGQLFHSHTRTRSSTTSGQNNPTTTTVQMNGCKFASNILCRFTFSLFLLIIALFLFHLSFENVSNPKEGSNIIAGILLIIAFISFIRTYQKLRRYYIILDTRRRIVQRLRERQQVLALNNNDNQENIHNDLPSYKELFPSHQNINNNSHHDSSLSLQPPSYDDFIKTLIIRHPTTNFLSQINSTTQCIWITDRTQRPLSIRDSVTYV